MLSCSARTLTISFLCRAASSHIIRNRLKTSAANIFFEKPKMPETTTIKLMRPAQNVYHVSLDRPKYKNAINAALWRELRLVFEYLNSCSDCRAIILNGSGDCFSSGLDLKVLLPILLQVSQEKNIDVGRKALILRSFINLCQESVSSIEKCAKPVIAAICGPCIGAGISLASAADIRLASEDAFFSVKEIEVGITADVGFLNRINKIVGNDSIVREWTFTGREFTSAEAMEFGFISKRLPLKECFEEALNLARKIAEKSPTAVIGAKLLLNNARNHTIDDSLEYIKLWNQGFLQSADLVQASASLSSKQKPHFEDA